jgi:hypothetical protein
VAEFSDLSGLTLAAVSCTIHTACSIFPRWEPKSLNLGRTTPLRRRLNDYIWLWLTIDSTPGLGPIVFALQQLPIVTILVIVAGYKILAVSGGK